MKNDAFDLPESLYEFAQISDFPKVVENLSNLAEQEDWTYQHSADTDKTGYPILANYIRNTYRRLATEKKIAFSKNGKFSCFDTGLASKSQSEPIYMMFEENANPMRNLMIEPVRNLFVNYGGSSYSIYQCERKPYKTILNN